MTRDQLTQLETAGTITKLEAEYLWLHDIKGLSYRQIGLAKNVAGQTVHERCRRAHAKIARARKDAA